MKITEPFKGLYNGDKSKGKAKSSTLMWFVALCYDTDSLYYKMAPDEKHPMIGADYAEDDQYYEKNQEILDVAIEAYQKLFYTAMERHLHEWEELIEKRTQFIKQAVYDLKTFEQLDKMAIGTDKVYATLKKIMQDLSREDAGTTSKGDSELSATDKGLM